VEEEGMGASLRYAKVIDRDEHQRRGGGVRPSLDNVVYLTSEPPADAAPFTVLRAWDDFDAFTETWRIVDPHGQTVREPVSREVVAGQETLDDIVDDQLFDYDEDGYQIVFEIDGREVARVGFRVAAA
jgi:hypothetical protein